MDAEAEKKKLLREIFATNEFDDSSSNNLQQLEFKIHTHRVLQIFDNLIKCMGLIFCLPEMIRNQDLMTAYFDYIEKEEVSMFCHMLMDDYIHQEIRETHVVTNIFEKIMKSDLKNELAGYIDFIPLESKDLYENMKSLRNLAKNRMELTAAKEMAKEKVLHRIYLANIKNQERIKVLQEKIDEHDSQFKDILSDKYTKIEHYKRQIETLKDESKDEIAKHIFESDKIMLRQCKDSDCKQQDMRESVDASREKYQKTLDANLRTEKQLRERKVKITQQLQQWIAKYDIDVGVRTKEYEALTEKLNEEEATFKNWMEKEFEPQEKNYNFLMDEKEEEERRVHQEKLLMFMMNRAARLIQRYWRAMILRRKTKKGRKGRKNKK